MVATQDPKRIPVETLRGSMNGNVHDLVIFFTLNVGFPFALHVGFPFALPCKAQVVTW
jgi:hypothetical protein